MRVGILTAFSEMSETYSLCKVVRDQIKMILEARHQPVLFTLERFNLASLVGFEWRLGRGYPGKVVEIRTILPLFYKTDYTSLADISDEHNTYASRAAAILAKQTDIDVWFTHDILFTGWNLPLKLAVHFASDSLPNAQWLHWIHSTPGGGRRDYWTLPDGQPGQHRIVYPNSTDKTRVAEHFGVGERDVVTIPHVADIRDWMQTSQAKEFAGTYGLLDAEIVSVFPVPMDRAESKGLIEAARVLAQIQALGRSAQLVVIEANSVDERDRQIRDRVLQTGILPSSVSWTSHVPGFEKGAPAQFVRDLMLAANLFIFPSKNESFGFTMAEAALSGQLLVLNSSLPMQFEIAGPNTFYFPFGSHNNQVQHSNEHAFYRGIAQRILHELDQNPCLQMRTRFKRLYNRPAVWRKLETAIEAERPLMVETKVMVGGE